MKLGHAHGLPPSASEVELLDLIVKEAPTEGREVPPRRFHNYAPLNSSKTQVLMEIREQLSRPERMRSHPSKRNPNKFCLYHHDHGHDTEECIQLQDEIEELVRRGRLS